MQRPSNSAIKEYANVGLQTGVAASDPHGLVLLMYDGALEALARGRRHMEGGQITAKCADLAMATNIIAEGLKASLDLNVGGEIAQNLADLYDYMTDRLLLANQHNRPELVIEVTELLRQLRDAWKQIGKPQAQAAGPAPVPPAPTTYKPGPTGAKAPSAPAASTVQATPATYTPAPASARAQSAPTASPVQASRAAPASLKQTYGPAATGQAQAAGATPPGPTPPGPSAAPENEAPAVSSQTRRLAAAYGVR